MDEHSFGDNYESKKLFEDNKKLKGLLIKSHDFLTISVKELKKTLFSTDYSAFNAFSLAVLTNS